MTVTSILQGQAGIQYGSVSDKSEADPRDSLVNALFVGEFKRGRFDAPFKVTLENIRAVLGYEPDNMIYMAIEDALADGAPFVWVMRLQGGAQVDHAYLTFANFDFETMVKINGRVFVLGDRDDSDFARELYENGLGIYSTYDSLGCRTLYRFQNMTSQPLNIVIENAVDYGFGLMILSPQENTTVRGSRSNNDYSWDWNEGVDTVQFSLAPDTTLLNFSPDQVVFEPYNPVILFSKNSANQVYRYQFILNDQVLINGTTGNDYFTMTTNDEFLQILDAVESVSVTWYLDNVESNHTGNVEFGISSASDRFFKLKIRQLGNIDQNTKIYIDRGSVKTDTPTEYTVEGYAYDPLDLEIAIE